MYEYDLPPPRRCTACSTSFAEYLAEDRDRMRAVLMANERKLQALKLFLATSRNKELDLKSLDPEVRRVLQ